MILNAFLEGIIAVLLGVGLVVLSKFYALPELDTEGTLLIGAGVGYILRELGPATPGK